jgi:hypothetical protein
MNAVSLDGQDGLVEDSSRGAVMRVVSVQKVRIQVIWLIDSSS